MDPHDGSVLSFRAVSVLVTWIAAHSAARNYNGRLMKSVSRFRCLLHVIARWFAVLVFALSSAAATAAPSACTALWGTQRAGVGSTQGLSYYNTVSNQWVSMLPLPTAGNALSGYEGDGTLYLASTAAVPASMYRVSFSNSTGSMTLATVAGGNISVPTSLAYTDSVGTLRTLSFAALVGATLDRGTTANDRRMFLLGTTNAATTVNANINGTTTQPPLAAIGLLDPESPATVSWQVITHYTAGGTLAYPAIGGSGDIFADQQTGAIWLVTNPPGGARILQLSLNYSGLTLNTATVAGTASIQVSGTPLANSLGAVGVDPLTGGVYLGDGIGTTTWSISDHRTAPTVAAVQLTTSSGATDAGNCVAPPDAPTVVKSFSPTTGTTIATAVMSITINNPNKVPIFTTSNLVDNLPTNMSINTTPAVTATCFTNGVALASKPTATTMTAVAGATSATIVSGSIIPGGDPGGGSCTFSVAVRASVTAFFTNVIPAGSLTTTAGSNASSASATFQAQNVSLPNAPTISKSFNPVTSTNSVTTTLTIVITNPNTITNTLTTAFVDILPANMVPANNLARSISCFRDGVLITRPPATTVTAPTITSPSVTITNASLIPGGVTAGSCSFSWNVSTTVAGIYANTIPAGSLTTGGGTNATAATATYYRGVSDFSVVKSQAIGSGGVTTTAQIDVPSGATITYIFNIRNEGGVGGTRTFTDTIPTLVTPVLSVTAVGIGGATCTTRTVVLTGQTIVQGTVTGASPGGGCDVTVLAKVSTTAAITTVTNSVGIYTVTNAVEASTANDTATVALIIKPGANLSIQKSDGTLTLVAGATNIYNITVTNAGPAAADGAVVKDPSATGLSCTTITCSASGGASCPLPTQLFVSALQSGTGLAIPTFPSGGQVVLQLTCTVTATGY